MKKYVQNFWVRLVACLLCTVSVVGLAGSAVLVAGFSSASKEEVYENGNYIVAENYAAYIYDNLNEEFLENMDAFLAETNFDCAISQVEYGVENVVEENEAAEERTEDAVENKEDAEEVVKKAIEDVSTLLYSSLENEREWDYEISISEGAQVNPRISSIWDALRITPITSDGSVLHEVAIDDYILDKNTGLFYYQTSEGYFVVDCVRVWMDGVYYDYELIADEGLYYNGYYNIYLNPSSYRQWEQVEIGDEICLISGSQADSLLKFVEDSSKIEENLCKYTYYKMDDSICFYTDAVKEYVIQLKLKDSFYNEEMRQDDLFSQWFKVADQFFELEDDVVKYIVSFVLLFILSFALLIYSAEGEKDNEKIWYKIPLITFSMGALIIEGIGVLLIEELCNFAFSGYNYNLMPMDMAVTLLVLFVAAMVFAAFLWMQNIITRFKTKTFWRYSEFCYAWKVWKWCWSKLTHPFKLVWDGVQEHTPLFWKGLVVLGAITLVELFCYMASAYDAEALFVFFMVIKLIEIPAALYVLFQMKVLQEGSKRISAGDLSHPIDTSKMFWEFKRHGENINNVSNAIRAAVNEQMKSERFKTELITNVSHDIKTPLTSIINYVDLMKKEDITDETLCEYVDVLERQSARLKKLIEDLMEASKASTGNLPVNLEECDVEVLLTQLIGEFEEKLQVNSLEAVVEKPEHPVIVMADGRHIWRVFDNLLNNACKYSMPNTRVYISLKQEEKQAVIVFKNISKAALNIPSDELMERFVRGDSSRNTEGSGLGLSIAQSLTELMNGTMKLDIDGDLFKVTLTFLSTNSNKK